MRSKRTINRLNMYKNFKAKRDSSGKIINPAPFQSKLPSGTMARVEPNRRWFGNTRIISQDSLQSFKEIMKVRNPYEVTLRQTKLPISLLNEKKQKSKSHLLAHESYSHVFGKKAQRIRPKISSDNIDDFAKDASLKLDKYDSGRDHNIVESNEIVKNLASEPHFKAGRSKRIWNELFKVLDSSDVVLYVLDSRDPLGTRSPYIENYLKERPHKHFILVLNKVDLIPVWVTKQWKTILSREYPTLVFHADVKKPLGKSALIGLLRQFSRFHAKDRTQISVGVIGYPNVGKSSLINTLKSKKVCNVAPIAGETKVWQYITLMKSIYLIDCPGVVYPQGDTESDLVMKGVVRVEYLDSPEIYIPDVMKRVKLEYFQRRYNLPTLPKQTTEREADAIDDDKEEDEVVDWSENSEVFLETVAKSIGRLLKGGEPDIETTAKKILNDFQRGYLPYFIKPELSQEDEENFKALGMTQTDSSKGLDSLRSENPNLKESEKDNEGSENDSHKDEDTDNADEIQSSNDDGTEDESSSDPDTDSPIDLGIEMSHPITNAVDDKPRNKQKKKRKPQTHSTQVVHDSDDPTEEEDDDDVSLVDSNGEERDALSIERKRLERQLKKIKNKMSQSLANKGRGHRQKNRLTNDFVQDKKKKRK